MARYGEAFRNRVVARLLLPESANVGVVAKEIGVSVQTLERWREEAGGIAPRPRPERSVNLFVDKKNQIGQPGKIAEVCTSTLT